MHCYRPLRDFLLNRMSFLKNDRAKVQIFYKHRLFKVSLFLSTSIKAESKNPGLTNAFD